MYCTIEAPTRVADRHTRRLCNPAIHFAETRGFSGRLMPRHKACFRGFNEPGVIMVSLAGPDRRSGLAKPSQTSKNVTYARPGVNQDAHPEATQRDAGPDPW